MPKTYPPRFNYLAIAEYLHSHDIYAYQESKHGRDYIGLIRHQGVAGSPGSIHIHLPLPKLAVPHIYRVLPSIYYALKYASDEDIVDALRKLNFSEHEIMDFYDLHPQRDIKDTVF